MRYQVGEKLIVVSFQYQDDTGISRFSMPYSFHEKGIEKIWMKELEVKEHHKVSWEYDSEDKKDNDGYILVDGENEIYHNQYPRASYGQVSSEADFRFHRQMDLETYKNRRDSSSFHLYEHRLLTQVYSDIVEGIGYYAKSDVPNARLEKLLQVKADLEKQLASEFKKKFVSKPIHEDHPDIVVWSLEDLPKGRFQVGQKLITVFFEIEERELSGWFIMPYLYDHRKVKKIWLKELEVKEHHKVAWSEDPKGEKKYDGYILQDSDGKYYHNQYPTAAYGQISTEADGAFERNFPGGKDELELYFNDPKEPTDFKLLTEVYWKIARGIANIPAILANPERAADHEDFRQKLDFLTAVKEDIDKQLAETFKKKMESKPFYEGSRVLKWFLTDL